MNSTPKNPVDDIWTNATETLRTEIDQTLNGSRLLALHRKKFNRITNELSLFSKKLPLFSAEQRILNQDEFNTFNELFAHLSNLNRMIDNYSDFNAVKTIQSMGFNTIKSSLSFINDFIFKFNLLTNRLDLPPITVDKMALRDEDQVADILDLLNFLKFLNIYDVEENTENPDIYSELYNKVLSYLESNYSGYEETDDICLRRSLFLSREKDEDFELKDEETETTFYGRKEFLKELSNIPNIKIFKHDEIEIKSSRCFHHGTNSDIYLGLLKSTKRVVSVELFHSLIFSEDQFVKFIQKVQFLSKVDHFSIVPLIGVIVDSSICVLSEYMPMNSLYESIHGSRKNKLLNGTVVGNIIDDELMINPEVNNQISQVSIIHSSSQSNLLGHHMSREQMSADLYELTPKDMSYESQQTVIALGVAYAMRYLHSKGFVHMSLRTSEIYLDANGRPKLKFSKHTKIDGTKMEAVSRNNVKVWTPPEIIDVHSNESTENIADLDDDNFDEELSGKKVISPRKPGMHKDGSANDIVALSLPIPADNNQQDFSESEDSFAMSSTRQMKEINVDKKIDVYAYGILLWELFTKDWAFAGLTPQLITKEVLENDQRPLLPQNCPRNLAKLIQSCWQTDPKKRPTFDEICQMIETGNYNFPGTDPVDLAAFISYCNRIEKRPRRKSVDANSLSSPMFYDNPHLTVGLMIERFMKEGSADNLEFIENLYNHVKTSMNSNDVKKVDLFASLQSVNSDPNIFPKLSDLVQNESEEYEETSSEEILVNDDNFGIYIFNRSSLSLISSYFLSSSLSARLIAVELFSFIYNNRLFDDENSMAVIVPNIIRNINQMNYLYSLTSTSQFEESKTIINGSLKLLSLFLNLNQESGLLINTTNAPSFNSFINLLFSASDSIRNFALDFYNCYLSKYQPSNNLLIRFVTKFVNYSAFDLSNKEITKIIKIVSFLLKNERSFSLFSVDDKAITTISNMLTACEQNEQKDVPSRSFDDDEDDDDGDAINMNGEKISFSTRQQYKSTEITVSCLFLLLNLATNTNYLNFYQQLAETVAPYLKSSDKNISTLSCAFLARIIPSIGLSNSNADFSFLTDDILRELSEDLDIYRLRLFGSFTTTFRSAQVNLQLDELILERIHQKIRVSLSPVSVSSQQPTINRVVASKLTTGNSLLAPPNDDEYYYEEEEEEEDGGFSIVEIPNLTDTTTSILLPSGSIRTMLHENSFNQREFAKEGRLAAVVLESQASQTPYSRTLLDAIDTFFDYFFTLRQSKDTKKKESRSRKYRRPSYFDSYNYTLTLEDEEKFRECFVFLSNMSVDPHAALKIFDRIEEFLSVASPNYPLVTRCFFNVLTTFEVIEKIRSLMDDENQKSATEFLMKDLINKCLEYYGSDYTVDAAKSMEMLSSIPGVLAIMKELKADNYIKDYLKKMITSRNAEQLHLPPSYLRIQEEIHKLKQMEKVLKEVEEEQMVSARLSARRNSGRLNHSGEFDRNDDNIQNLQIKQKQQQQIKKQQKKIFKLQSKEKEKKSLDSYLKILSNRILSRIMFE